MTRLDQVIAVESSSMSSQGRPCQDSSIQIWSKSSQVRSGHGQLRSGRVRSGQDGSGQDKFRTDLVRPVQGQIRPGQAT